MLCHISLVKKSKSQTNNSNSFQRQSNHSKQSITHQPLHFSTRMIKVKTKVLKVDMLYSLEQMKDNGEMVFRGAEDVGACKVKIVEAQFGPSKPNCNLILSHCNHQLVLCAQIKQWPISVDATGENWNLAPRL